MPPKEICNCQHNDLGCNTYPKCTVLVTSNFGLQEVTICDRFQTLEQSTSVRHLSLFMTDSRGHFDKKYDNGEGGYSCQNTAIQTK